MKLRPQVVSHLEVKTDRPQDRDGLKALVFLILRRCAQPNRGMAEAPRVLHQALLGAAAAGADLRALDRVLSSRPLDSLDLAVQELLPSARGLQTLLQRPEGLDELMGSRSRAQLRGVMTASALGPDEWQQVIQAGQSLFAKNTP